MPPYHLSLASAISAATHAARTSGVRQRVVSEKRIIGWAVCPRRIYWVRAVSA